MFTDELIRQVTIECAERGLLLLRVRDEIRMTIAAYQTLYESSVAFGMRKALQAEQGKFDMEKKVCSSIEVLVFSCSVMLLVTSTSHFVWKHLTPEYDRARLQENVQAKL